MITIIRKIEGLFFAIIVIKLIKIRNLLALSRHINYKCVVAFVKLVGYVK
jgi:hypothetical protein